MPTSAIKGSIWDFSNMPHDELNQRLKDRQEEIAAIEAEFQRRAQENIAEDVETFRQLWGKLITSGVKFFTVSEDLHTTDPYTDLCFDISDVRRVVHGSTI